MNKIEQIGDQFHVVKYSGTGYEIISKKYYSYNNAVIALDKINEQQKNYIDSFPLIKQLYKWATNDIALAKKHKNIAITDTKCGTIFIEFWNNVFAMRWGEKSLVTDNEIMILDILKGLYKFEIETSEIKK